MAGRTSVRAHEGAPHEGHVDGTVVAEAPKEDLITIEGNWYFPPASVGGDRLEPSPTPYTCPWKGPCQYFDGRRRRQAPAGPSPGAYPHLFDGAVQRVGKDFTDYVAFGKGVKVSD